MRTHSPARRADRSNQWAVTFACLSIVGLLVATCAAADPAKSKSTAPKIADELPPAITKKSTSGEVHRFSEHTGPVTGVAVSRDGRYLATSSADHSTRVWQLDSLKLLHTLKADEAPVNCVAFTPDGAEVIAGSGPAEEGERNMRLWDRTTGRMTTRLAGPLEGNTSVSVSPDGTLLASTHPTGVLRVRAFATIGDVKSYDGHKGGKPCYAAAFTPDSRFVVSGGGDGKVIVWAMGTPRPGTGRMDTGQQEVRALACHPDGTIASGGRDGSIRFWTDWANDDNWRLVRSIAAHKGAATSLAFSSDGKLLISGGEDRSVRVWETATGKLRKNFTGHTGSVNTIALLRSERFIVSGSDDATARIWRLGPTSAKSGTTPAVDDGHPDQGADVAASRESRVTPLTPGDAPIPSAKELAAAERLINEVFKDDLAKAKRPAEKFQIAEKMLEQARRDQTAGPERYALLTSAQRIATELGSVSIAMAATDELVTHFKADVWTIEADAVARLAAKATKDRAELAQAAIQLAGEAADANRYAEALQMLKAGATAARAARNADLARRAKDLDARIEHDQKRWEAYRQGLKMLAGKPDDPQANLAVAQFLCFNKGQWSALHYLVKCSDKALVDLATSDIADPETASDQLALAEQWQTVADNLPSADRPVCQAAAAYWYGRALPELTGLSKLKAERSLEKIGEVPENLRRADR